MAKYPLALILLAGCAAEPTLPREVRIPIPVACISAMPQKPAIRAEAEIKALPDYDATIATWTERLRLKDYAAELEAVAEPCLKP